MQKLYRKIKCSRKYVVWNRKANNFLSKISCRSFACQASVLLLGGAFIAYLYMLSLVFQHSLAHFLVINFSQLGISTCYQYYNLLQFLYLMVLLVFSANKTNFLSQSNYSLNVRKHKHLNIIVSCPNAFSYILFSFRAMIIVRENPQIMNSQNASNF